MALTPNCIAQCLQKIEVNNPNVQVRFQFSPARCKRYKHGMAI